MKKSFGTGDGEDSTEKEYSWDHIPCLKNRPLLTYDDCFFNWISPEKPLTVKEVEQMADGISNSSEAVLDSILDHQLQMYPVETISRQLSLAFCHIALDNGEAGNDLKKADGLIEEAFGKNLISEDYVQGLRYLLKGLKASWIGLLLDPLKVDHKTLKNVGNFLGPRKHLQDLTPLARAAIAGVYAFFIMLRWETEVEIELLRYSSYIDPENIEWLLNLHKGLRLSRKRKSFGGAPCAEEKESVLRALRSNQDHALVKLHKCIYLCDAIRASDPPKNCVLEGYVEFSTVSDTVKQIKAWCNEILASEEGPTWIQANLTIAEIVGFKLYHNHRNIKMAKECLDNVLRMKPKSSKANHKMGMLLLANGGDFEEALGYIRISFEHNQFNNFALVDIMQILLRNPEKNASELDEIIEKYIIQNCNEWSADRLALPLFTKGLYHYMRMEKEEALWIWIESYKSNSKVCLGQFEQLKYLCPRYKWDNGLISSDGVLAYLDEVLKDGGRALKRRMALMDDFKIISAFIFSCKAQKGKPKMDKDGRCERSLPSLLDIQTVTQPPQHIMQQRSETSKTRGTENKSWRDSS